MIGGCSPAVFIRWDENGFRYHKPFSVLADAVAFAKQHTNASVFHGGAKFVVDFTSPVEVTA